MSKNELWFFIAAPIIIFTFAVIEGYAICYPQTQNTLSRLIYNTSRRYPVTTYFAGIFTATLAIHFFHYGILCD